MFSYIHRLSQNLSKMLRDSQQKLIKGEKLYKSQWKFDVKFLHIAYWDWNTKLFCAELHHFYHVNSMHVWLRSQFSSLHFFVCCTCNILEISQTFKTFQFYLYCFMCMFLGTPSLSFMTGLMQQCLRTGKKWELKDSPFVELIYPMHIYEKSFMGKNFLRKYLLKSWLVVFL